jgi:hypothetical protein
MTVAAYRDHPLRTTIKRILDMQGSEVFIDPVVAENETYAYARDRVFALTRALEHLVSSTPAALISPQGLAQLHANMQAPLAELAAFEQDRSPSHLTNAATQFDASVQPLLWAFTPLETTGEVLAGILDAQADEGRKSIADLGIRRDQLLSKFQQLSVLATEFEGRIGSLTENAAKERAEAAATVAKLQQSFAERETERSAEFVTHMKEMRDGFELFELEARGSSKALLDELGVHQSEARRIVQVVGNIGVTGNYQQIANAEAKQANAWRWATVGVFAVGISVAAATFVKFWGQPFSSENAWSVAIRLLYAVAITAPAWYTARESARHRTNSDRARQTELELASIGPFIELMPEATKVQIREHLIPSYFGKIVDAHTAKPPVDLGEMKDLVVEVAKALKR